MLSKSKLDSTETLVSQALIDMEIVLIQKKKKKNEFVNMWMVKRIEHLHHQKSVYMYKMVDISAETWNKTGVSVIKVH